MSARSGGELEIVALSAGSDWGPLVEQARRTACGGSRSPTAMPPHRRARRGPAGRSSSGPDGLVALDDRVGLPTWCSTRSSARPGCSPRSPSLGEGIDLALANKESLVVGGELVDQLAEATGAAIIPVDSEHSALHQLIASERPGTVDRLVLTASGGPFRGRAAAICRA